MIAVYGGTVLTGALSAFVPATPVEPYLVGLVIAGGYDPVALGVAAAIGQTAGKLVLFLTARGALRSARLRRWLTGRIRAPRRGSTMLRPIRAAAGRLTALLDRPAYAVPVVLLSATTGIPPLLTTSLYAARTRISGGMFALACLLGRSIRFAAIALAPHLLGYGS